MVMCFVPGCKHYSEQRIYKFFVFPADPAEIKKWINLIRRKDREPSKHSLVCSCHFVNMDKNNRPTLFEFNVKREFDFESPEKRKRTVKAREVEANLLSALEATNISSEAAGPSKISETETPSTSRSEVRLSSIEDIPSCSRSVSRASSASVEAENYFLKQEILELTEKLKNSTTRFSYRVSLNIPPFLSTPQFTEAQVYETQRIAKARIHVERAI
ncbi:hypothetical protein JTB14_007173 [Gonioctena quinquepunctata]|nr:hypothetical protein JTB14_007173 [Gonioctena quinquepunctata]